MEHQRTTKPVKTFSKEDNLKKCSSKNPDKDSSISITYDSAADCSYKSGEISSRNISSKEQVSELSISSGYSSKSDQNLIFDSGLEADSLCEWAPLPDETPEPDDEPQELDSPEILPEKEKLPLKEIFSQDKDGDTFLHLATVQARSDVIFPLIRLAPHPDFLDITNDLFQTPLHLATLTGKSHIVRRLVVAGATLDIQDHSGNTPLHIASRNGDLDCVQAILTSITDSELEDASCLYRTYIQEKDLSYVIDTKNFDGQSCIHLAAFGGWKKVLEFLFSHNADINQQDGKSGRTALHYAVENENYELVRLLLSKGGANPLVRNYAGRTPLNVANSLCKRNPSKYRQLIVELLKSFTEKWGSFSELDSDSSSEESDYIFEAIKTFDEISLKK